MVLPIVSAVFWALCAGIVIWHDAPWWLIAPCVMNLILQCALIAQAAGGHGWRSVPSRR